MDIEKLKKIIGNKKFFCIYLFISLLPLLASFTYMLNKFYIFKNDNVRLCNLEKLSNSSMSKRKQMFSFLEKYSKPDPNYLDNKIENISLMKNELSLINELQKNPLFSKKETLKKRNEFLSNKENRLQFAEENIKTTSLVKETDLILLHPVQVDISDLNEILSKIENIKNPETNIPQIIITNFELKKENSFFTLNFKLLKREFLKKSI